MRTDQSNWTAATVLPRQQMVAVLSLVWGVMGCGGAVTTDGGGATSSSSGGATETGGTTSTGGLGATGGAGPVVDEPALGWAHSCARLGDSTVECWGFNGEGELGDGTMMDRATPVVVQGLSGAVQIVAGGVHSCARFGDGTVKCWGGNYNGELGDGTTTQRSTPVVVRGLP
jgi:hypothetical protein